MTAREIQDLSHDELRAAGCNRVETLQRTRWYGPDGAECEPTHLVDAPDTEDPFRSDDVRQAIETLRTAGVTKEQYAALVNHLDKD